MSFISELSLFAHATVYKESRYARLAGLIHGRQFLAEFDGE